MAIMETYYQELVQLLPVDESLEISLNQETEVIQITTDNVMIHGGTAAHIYAYCAQNHLRCYITWDYVKRQICLGILKDIC